MKAKRYPISFRCKEDLYRRMKAAADASGRSVAQEIEIRLEVQMALERALEGRQRPARDPTVSGGRV